MRTVEIKTSELQSAALDWAVATIEYPGDGYMNSVHINRKHAPSHCIEVPDHDNRCYKVFRPSTDQDQGGTLIDQHLINTLYQPDINCASSVITARWIGSVVSHSATGPTRLIAAMRCLVAAKLGDTVQVPEELLA